MGKYIRIYQKIKVNVDESNVRYSRIYNVISTMVIYGYQR